MKLILHFIVGNSGHISSFGFNISKTGKDSKQRFVLKRDAKKRRTVAAAGFGDTRITGVGIGISFLIERDWQRGNFLKGLS
jgi:hypothetical protein